jgi:hypothetical protein
MLTLFFTTYASYVRYTAWLISLTEWETRDKKVTSRVLKLNW